ncbi:hypothetical protein G7B40_036860 [Aetokthonos hydrillicola Thurmond2011]|jgi:hypothetical protein|uniref:Uncharacterized protein n=1 Tax=Aetokthonos hydrillicola Thurmond2011 TaxID=2712845 RepID=A0AAP5IGF3_9CYAN|nr:hypothetical protein [Aetokthonos hydrillicola]MBO3459649.1 hypothetical protein [Aetokthonos hydrillicola CCALA 1050]MBW4589011.1 hypothetical protein [Aetokthonos hydrillicola CCALA 1050]MDR9900084.1 hypothetical protein [Aetokthonos hydrillicola Thurmond2011]
MYTLNKILLFSFGVSFLITGIRSCLPNLLSKQSDEFLVDLMLSYPPKTQEQANCAKQLYDSTAFIKADTKDKIITKCQLQQLNLEIE